MVNPIHAFHLQAAEVCEAQPLPDLLTPLFPHQRQALAWMMQREVRARERVIHRV